MTRFATEGAAHQPSQRQLRVGELVRKVLSELLSRGEVRDPELEGQVITVPEVRMSPDLKHAHVFITSFGDEADRLRVVAALDRNKKWFRGRVGRQMTTKFTPELRFTPDTRFDDDDQITAILNSDPVRRDLDIDPDEPDQTGA